MSRYARERRVYYVEEPISTDGSDHLEVSLSEEGVHVVVPHLNAATRDSEAAQAALIRAFLEREAVERYVIWYYTPMALPLAAGLQPLATVYDCMDELSAFAGAPPLLVERERELFSQAELVFTGGHTLYEHKRSQHPNVHAFPSSVDVPHFAKARAPQDEPEDQKSLTRPRLGFYGVIDERMDLELLEGVARARPDWNLVMLGPVVKVDPESLPRAPNVHYLGGKSYAELPRYASGWDVALLPFARNDSTRFISPTKTPEYLAAGLPVVSTSIRDVVRPYQALGLVHIADSTAEFVAACEAALSEPAGTRLAGADEFLAQLSWDKTWTEMSSLVESAIGQSSKANDRAPRGVELDSNSNQFVAGGRTCSTI
jgi:glycosyltransferase involved in cell wall biosynthesis